MTPSIRNRLRRLALAVLALACTLPGLAADTPSSTGPVAIMDTPVIRAPLTSKPPKIDGVWEEGEWDDAAALSGFWYDRGQAHFLFLAPHQTNCSVYVAYDKDYLYLAYDTPVYPENSWLKARGRYPDVVHHPRYGQQWDDHMEIELRPLGDRVEGFRRGLFKFYVNPINATTDWYWSQKTGTDKGFTSKLIARSGVGRKRWVVECAIPLEALVYQQYDVEVDGKPLVTLPPPNGTTYLCWFTRGIGGNGNFFNVFDNHVWNTTKTQLILDSSAPTFQINSLGPMMDDIIDLQLTVKNHDTKSQTVRVGFFVESADGNVYSSYNSDKLKDGLLELSPGETRKLRLQQVFPGISTNGNVLWFDVRAAGRPGKVLFRTRLIEFHAMDGGYYHDTEQTFKEKRLDIIEELRPPRKDFDFWFDYSEYENRLSAIVDLGLHGASADARRATEARLNIVENFGDEKVVIEESAPFNGNFASFLLDLPKLQAGKEYGVGVLLFDKDKRIVGEQYVEDPLRPYELPWKGYQGGLNDVVWDPFVPITKTADGLETLKHRFTLTDAGLPAQIYIKPDPRELPLEQRRNPRLSDAELLALGRGPQLKSPFRLVAVVAGQPVVAKVTKTAELAREWQSEHEYVSELALGPVRATLTSRYDCDGTWHAKLDYTGQEGAKIDALHLVGEVQGLTDLVSWTPGGGMAGAARWDCRLPMGEGNVWDSAIQMQKPELFYSRFVPLLWFGSGDRAFTWLADTDRGWLLDADGSAMSLDRAADGSITMTAKFINHPVTLDGQPRRIEFEILTHPAKPRPEKWRDWGWFYRGRWAHRYASTPLDMSDAELEREKRLAETGMVPGVTRSRLGFWTSISNVSKASNVTGLFQDVGYQFGNKKGTRNWSDAHAWYCGRRWIQQGRWVGFWWDEYWPDMTRTDDLAGGYAYLRDPQSVKENELPWQAGWNAIGMREGNKRLARMSKEAGLPQRQFYWSNHAGTILESFGWDTQLVEECGAGNRSFELDTIVQFPNSLWRYECKKFTGMITRVVPDTMPTKAGDDPRLDRQYVGRTLLNDITLSPSGPHGAFSNFVIPLRVLQALRQFGYFDEDRLEVIPFWRSAHLVTWGERGEQAEGTYLTVYRYPLEGGGYRALFVIMNETDQSLQVPLTIKDSTPIFGGRNSLTAAKVHGEAPVSEELQGWWQAVSAELGDEVVLKDLETGDIVARTGEGEAYGPVYVPYRNYRILYGEAAH